MMNKKNILTYEVYQCENCEGCPFRELCTKSEYGRVIQRNGHWLEQKAKVGTEWGLLMLGYDFKQLIRLMNT